MHKFCEKNSVSSPEITLYSLNDWFFSPICAYYRPTQIHICLDLCSLPALETQVRKWSYPGSTSDKTPYGVIQHELGHHIDRLLGDVKGSYWSEFSSELRKLTKEKPLTSYCPNDAEWFAEIFRLFITNPDLLRLIRPKTYSELRNLYTPVSNLSWRIQLGENVPPRIFSALTKKVAKGE